MIVTTTRDSRRRGAPLKGSVSMMTARALTICAFGVALLGQRVDAQDFSRYRTFDLGVGLAAVSTSTGVAASEAKIVRERPAVLQDLEWRPSRWNSGTGVSSTDPVEQMVFSFYDDQLFRIVVDYSHDGTQGMTDADVIEAIAAVYGAPLAKSPRAAARVPTEVETASGLPIARWGDADHSVVLYRTSTYGRALRLIVTALPLDSLARKAEARARHLDDQEGPRREVARQKKEQADLLAAAEKARIANKKIFLP
jgi:hypothetical protein